MVITMTDEEMITRLQIPSDRYLNPCNDIVVILSGKQEEIDRLKKKISAVKAYNEKISKEYLSADKDGKEKMIGEYQFPAIDDEFISKYGGN